jgi:UDP-N-acetylmuramyl pentapeptide phosphotransferase/UDP-N-acetylglucosamine-1-phosphate transferase
MATLPSLPPSVYVAGIASFVAAVALVLTKRWHGRFSMDGLLGVQRMHTTPTPRVGGVAILFGVVAALVVANPERQYILGTLLIAGLPAFAFGLAEDVTKKVSVGVRLMATIASGVLGWMVTGLSLTRIDVPYLDHLLSYTVVSVAFTGLAVGGVTNAVNIVDGFNGLASGFVVIALGGLAAAAAIVGDKDLSLACMVVAASTLGFLFINWPWGKLFLGDGGSYLGGFALAWISVLLVERNASVTAFVPLLICIHPVTEVLFSIYRRRMTHISPGTPDRLHLHTLVMRRVVFPRLRRVYLGDAAMARLMRNPITGLVLALMTLPAVILALLSLHSAVYAVLACLAFVVGYVTLYARLVRFHWCSPIGFLFAKPARRVDRLA